jgi:hypothetical protein
MADTNYVSFARHCSTVPRFSDIKHRVIFGPWGIRCACAISPGVLAVVSDITVSNPEGWGHLVVVAEGISAG